MGRTSRFIVNGSYIGANQGGAPFFLVTLTYLKKLGWATTNHNHKFEKNL